MKLPYDEADLSRIVTYPLAARQNKATRERFARPFRPGGGIQALLASIPDLLAGSDFRGVVEALERARAAEAPVIWGLGAHVIKNGLSPVVIDLMERGYVSAVALNGAGLIHDFELAVSGGTSEDVDQVLGPGRFGMADETGRLLNEALDEGVGRGLGLGQAAGAFLTRLAPPHADISIVAAAARLGVPVTVHVALGTDIIHMHPAASGSALGEGSLRDFRYFAASVARLRHGVYLNCGSAVVLPEVFLKAVAIARNQGSDLTGLTTVNLDFLRMYRPETNVVRRPVADTGRGFSLVGHHEILLPLLAAALVDGA